MPSPSLVLLSAAGSGKTTLLTQQALARPHRRIAILTYTLQNLEEIRRSFEFSVGVVPANVSIYSWYSFLLRECIRPYQSALVAEPRIQGLQYVSGRTDNRIPRAQERRYYLAGHQILSDRASEFAVRCNDQTQGRVMARLADLFDEVYVDEVQDLAGYDLDLLERLMATRMEVTLVGDTRQATYSTNHAARNAQYRGTKMLRLFEAWQQRGLCRIDHRTTSWRCTQAMCNLADSLYPTMPRTESGNDARSGHNGIVVVSPDAVDRYVSEFSPTVLRYDRKEDCAGLPAVNFGESKGRTYTRVLIFPNGPLIRFLRTGDPAKITSPAKYYVAFTRARLSLAFVYAGPCALADYKTYPSVEVV